MPATLLIVSFPLLLALHSTRPPDDVPGHSAHGSAFDSGMRQRPWRMSGIGHTHFAVTTGVPEVQEWFDQGNTLLQSFWFEEAERSFRWCLKLDPECAMAYWGLARCGLNWFARGPVDTPENKRYLDFLDEAVRRKSTVSERERRYIEAWDGAFHGEVEGRFKRLARRLQSLALDFPDDVEAKVLYAFFAIDRETGLGNELVLQQVFAKEPDHPGAHHARIHTWDSIAPEQALESCRRYGLVAPASGHANHMPGHIYSKVGMWHEAACSMDRATRVELRYMNDRLALPFETWNYPHNRNYLCYIQEQLGMAEASLRGARDLIAAPRDPEFNKAGDYGAADEGMNALVRALLKFERWDDVLKPGTIPWREIDSDRRLRPFAEAVALIGQGRLIDARDRLGQLEAAGRALEEKTKSPDPTIARRVAAAKGLLRAAEGDVLEGARLLADAAELERKSRDANDYENDPPGDPWPAFRLLGDVYRGHGDARLAIDAYQRGLAIEPNDAFALSGLAQAENALGDRARAKEFAGRLQYVWSNADPGLRWKREVDALGLDATPVAATPAPERTYRPDALADVGPSDWEPFAAPKLDVVDAGGAKVSLEDFRGKNVLLVFYLGEECVHCVEQLVAINARAGDFARENTVVLGVSSATPEANRGSEKLGGLAMRLLSDHDHENARRFASYDDFEGIELHSTILIDDKGRVRWKRTGGDPFTDIDFLLKTIGSIGHGAGSNS